MKNTSFNTLLKSLKEDFATIKFESGEDFYWSYTKQTIYYDQDSSDIRSLLHEVGHATLNHRSYKTDFDLLMLETEAWHKAKFISEKYNININQNHIDYYLDTYRNWLHKRAKCPNCDLASLQKEDGNYLCFNCKTTWKSPRSIHCKIVRQIV